VLLCLRLLVPQQVQTALPHRSGTSYHSYIVGRNVWTAQHHACTAR